MLAESLLVITYIVVSSLIVTLIQQLLNVEIKGKRINAILFQIILGVDGMILGILILYWWVVKQEAG